MLLCCQVRYGEKVSQNPPHGRGFGCEKILYFLLPSTKVRNIFIPSSPELQVIAIFFVCFFIFFVSLD